MKSQFREGPYQDFSIVIDNQEFGHNKTILSLRSEFIEAHLRFNPNQKLAFDTHNLDVDCNLLITAFNYLYEDDTPQTKTISDLIQYWRIYDFLQASFHRTLCAKQIATLVIKRFHQKNNENVEEMLNSDDYSEEILREIFKYDDIARTLVDQLEYDLFNKLWGPEDKKYLELIEVFNLQKFLSNKTIGRLAHYCTLNGIDKDWLPKWQNMVLEFRNYGIYGSSSNIYYTIVGKRNHKGETVPLDEIDNEYISYLTKDTINFKSKHDRW